VNVIGLDHLVLTVRSIPATVDFYQRVLGMRHVVFDGHFDALHFGSQKINLHPFRHEYSPHADIPAPGTGDVCLVCSGNLDEIVEELTANGVDIEHGPVNQTGARGDMRSVYFRDPDRNLIELAVYASDQTVAAS
jgi:catechol 2,3-dioxygenase-like lactoylglutathione lyase family enzyme